MRRRTLLALGVGFTPLLSAAQQALAQPDQWPSKPMRLIVPFPPGSASDILSRAASVQMSQVLGQPIVVDNRPGAGGVIGTEVVARAAPDGYTLLMATAAHTITAATFRNLPFDPKRDLLPIVELTTMPLLLVVHPSVPATTVQELVALAKSKPGQITFASSGVGTSHQMASELLKVTAGLDIVHVPYRGSAPAQLDLTVGRVSMMFDNIVAVINHVRAGRLRALAVSGPRRSAVLPDVPTMAEAGYHDFNVSAWFGLMTPAGTPTAVIDRVAAIAADAVRRPEVSGQFVADGAVVTARPAAEFARMLEEDYARWAGVARDGNIRIE